MKYNSKNFKKIKTTLKQNKLNILYNSSKDKVNLENITKILLKNRNIKQEDELSFFNPDFKNLLDPYLMQDMKKAVKRILKAKEKGERVVVFGDYDVDGVSSTALLSSFLRDIGIKVSYRLPHRAKDGYGLKKYFIDELKELQVTLIITVDCGTRDIEVIKYSKEKNIDIIITDHHSVPDIIPKESIAIINPKRKDNTYPFDKLAGAGVAFKLIHALSLELYGDNYLEPIIKYIDFASLGTVADCMPLIGENRLITQLGLKQMKYSKSPALKKLTEDLDVLNGETIGFQIGPRINACGRLDTPYKALKMLLASEENIDSILREIEELNNERKEITLTFLEQALSEIDSSKPVITWYSETISHGIIGLIAGRITEIYNKPCIVLTKGDGKMTASCRSPEYFSIVDALTHCNKFMIAYGGHKQAAGFSILDKDFKKFEQTIQEYALNKVKNIDKTKIITIDSTLDLNLINIDLLDKVDKLEPFGMGNPRPVFILKDCIVDRIEFLGQGEKHLKFILEEAGFSVIGFGLGEFREKLLNSKMLSFIGTLSRNVWMGNISIQFMVKDIFLE